MKKINAIAAYTPPNIPAAWTHRDGLILVSGRTSSGKTTTLYNALNNYYRPSRNSGHHYRIVTIEDHIEYQLEHATQFELGNTPPLTYPEVIHEAWRMRTDCLLVGELRDSETISKSLRLAGTGHLVYSPLHALNISTTLTQLLHLGADGTQLANSLRGVLHQSRLRKLCPDCKTPYTTTTAELKALNLPHDADSLPTAPITLYQSNGCDGCDNTGYKGSIVTHITLTPGEELRTALRNGADDATIQRLTEQGANTTITQASWGQALQGFTTLQELFRATA